MISNILTTNTILYSSSYELAQRRDRKFGEGTYSEEDRPWASEVSEKRTRGQEGPHSETRRLAHSVSETAAASQALQTRDAETRSRGERREKMETKTSSDKLSKDREESVGSEGGEEREGGEGGGDKESTEQQTLRRNRDMI